MTAGFLLLVLHCNPLTNMDCEWRPEGYFRTEERCALGGLSINPDKIARFKCVVPEPVPLPRPRPENAK